MEKTSINIPAFGGINKRHTRALGQPSQGKNFWTRSGSLFTREGSSLLTNTPFTSAIKSIHAGAKVNVPTRLLVEEGTRLWVKASPAAPWAAIKTDVTGTGYRSAIWRGFLLIFSGTQMMAYNIEANTLATITNTAGPVPAMQNVAVEKDIIWGWGPNHAESNLVRFNGYLKDAQGFILSRSKDVWPPDFSLDISGNSGTPVLDFIPYRSYRFCLTQKGSHLIYGDNEDDFRILPGDNIGVFRAGCSALAGSTIVWLNFDIKGMPKVYSYTGTEPTVISQPIEELLYVEDFTNVWAKALANQFWLIFPKATTTTCYVYDTDEREWYIHVFPAVFNAATLFAEHLQQQDIHFGLGSNEVARLDDSTTDFGTPITTEIFLGPFSAESRRIKLKRIWLEAEPRTKFDVKVYATADQGVEQGPFVASFGQGNPVKDAVRIHRVKGRSLYLRLTTTEKINELQQATLTVTAGGVK